jgi:hypothetical protein
MRESVRFQFFVHQIFHFSETSGREFEVSLKFGDDLTEQSPGQVQVRFLLVVAQQDVEQKC